MMKYECYVEEYMNARGVLSARLRDKKTDKKVVLVSEDPLFRVQFLAFLSQAKLHTDVMPTIFDRNGTDIVAIRGLLLRETANEIEVDPYGCEGGGFLYE